MMSAIRSEAGRWLAALVLLAVAGVAQAQALADQFYFVAKAGAAGSMSRAGQGQEAIFLRWGPVEGLLPADIERLVLFRDGEEIIDVAASAPPVSATKLQSWYDRPQHRQRKLAMLRWVNQLDGPEVSASRLGQRVHDLIIKDSAFAGLAARQDILVAQAQHRGLVDGGFVERNVEYELIAVNGAGDKRRLGRVRVDRDQDQPAPKPANLRQVHEHRCDAPERGLDHGTIKLAWAHGGKTATDRFAASLLVSGYDLYRSEEPIDPQSSPSALDVRRLASRVQSNGQGELILPGLVRLNGSVVTATGDGKHFTLDAPAVRKAGMRPGETYAVHLVPRDFAGHYGLASTGTFTVPDLLAPPAPWEVETAESATDKTGKLIWQHVNLENYTRAWPGRRFCNLEQARTSQRLEVAMEGKSCDEASRTINLAASEYRVYRFEQYKDTARFTDSDGDGHADHEERTASGPGDACNAAVTTGTRDFRVDDRAGVSLTARVEPDGGVIRELKDNEPAATPGTVYWYRIATVGDNGRISRLSAPVRMLVPERAPPTPPDDSTVTFTRAPECDYNASVGEEGTQLTLELPAEPRYQDPARVEASCLDGARIVDESLEKLARGANSLGAGICESIDNRCPGNSALFDIRDGNNRSLAVAALHDVGPATHEGNLRCNHYVSVTETCGTGPEPVAPGEMVQQLPELTVKTDQCAVLYRRIDGKRQKVETRCDDGAGLVDFNLELQLHPAGEQACYSVAIQNSNARVSASHDLSCFVMTDQVVTPPPPTPVDMSPGQNQATLSWLVPQARIQGTIISYYPADDPADSSQTLVPTPTGADVRGPQHKVSVALPPLSDAEDGREWCFVARAVGVAPASRAGEALSEASAPLCVRREVDEENLERIPWPERPAPKDLGDMTARFQTLDQLPLVRLSDAPDSSVDQTCDYSVPACGDGTSCLNQHEHGPRTRDCAQDGPQLCQVLSASAAEELGFVAYRQSRRNRQVGPFVQVSPLIERVHCEITRTDKTTNNQNRFHDPYMDIFRFSDGADWNGDHWVFKDQYPHEAGVDYRYQLIYFDSRGEITGFRTSNWVTAQ